MVGVVALALLLTLSAACRDARSEALTTQAPGWSDQAAIAALRARLHARGLGADITGGPMLARWIEQAPPHPLATNAAVPAAARQSARGAYLVRTDAGGWWVWPTADLGPIQDPLLPYD
jgi:hypothetical protein